MWPFAGIRVYPRPMSQGAVRRTLQPVNEGMARLSALFTADVRDRAEPYLGNGGSERLHVLQVLEDGGDVLVAEIEGTSRYRTAFRRFDHTMYYGCTCPFFTEGLIGCKHLWALVRRAGTGVLVRRAV